jgi:hypothetical protein
MASPVHTGLKRRTKSADSVRRLRNTACSGFCWRLREERNVLEAWAERMNRGAERGPASRRLSRIIGPSPERTFVLLLLRRRRTFLFFPQAPGPSPSECHAVSRNVWWSCRPSRGQAASRGRRRRRASPGLGRLAAAQLETGRQALIQAA